MPVIGAIGPELCALRSAWTFKLRGQGRRGKV